MLIVSDTNILSSLAAGDALHLLLQLFPQTTIQIPPSVLAELQVGFERERLYLGIILDSIQDGRIAVADLTEIEQTKIQPFPSKLNLGEREAIMLTKSRSGRLLCNDKRAIRYCLSEKIAVIDLAELLRLFWTTNLASPSEVREVIEQMKKGVYAR